jgi:hypothetical protein
MCFRDVITAGQMFLSGYWKKSIFVLMWPTGKYLSGLKMDSLF